MTIMDNISKESQKNEANTLLATGLRYWVQLQFYGTKTSFLYRLWDATYEVKTLKEALSYESIIDNTVEKAQVVDTVTNKIVARWK